jgi:hypothetical protein
MTINDISEENHHSSSSWSSSSNSDLKQKTKKNSKHRSFVETYDINKKNISQSKKTSNDIKPSGKSKLVLENVRKMIKDQNIQHQQFDDTRQKESARL